MRILVTFAVEAEFAPWRKLRDFRKNASARTSAFAFETTLGENRIDVFLTGIGRAQVEQTILRGDILLSRKPDVVISSGLAGALKEQLKPGDLITPHKVRSLRNDVNADADPALRAHAIQQGVSGNVGRPRGRSHRRYNVGTALG